LLKPSLPYQYFSTPRLESCTTRHLGTLNNGQNVGHANYISPNECNLDFVGSRMTGASYLSACSLKCWSWDYREPTTTNSRHVRSFRYESPPSENLGQAPSKCRHIQNTHPISSPPFWSRQTYNTASSSVPTA
jgi:hypothetical protein